MKDFLQSTTEKSTSLNTLPFFDKALPFGKEKGLMSLGS